MNEEREQPETKGLEGAALMSIPIGGIVLIFIMAVFALVSLAEKNMDLAIVLGVIIAMQFYIVYMLSNILRK